LVQLDYFEFKNKISQKKKKNGKIDKFYVNIIPYMEYSNKCEIEKQGNFRTFKQIKQEARFWLRIFSSDEIYVSELPKPYESSINSTWTSSSAGGARFVKNNDNMTVENPYWPLNPQYLLKFGRNTQMKIILRKTTGLFTVEEDKVGLILTKPNIEDKNVPLQQLLSKCKKYNKNDQLEKIIDNSKTILESKVIDYSKIQRKLAFYPHDWIVESSYSNNFTASLYMTFNKLDSPIMVIPTLAKEDSCFEYKLSSNFINNLVYSNKPIELLSLDNENNRVVVGEWNYTNAIGSHLALDDEKRKAYKKEQPNLNSNYKINMKNKTYLDNPKYHLSFDTFETLPEVEFEIKISRSEGIWGKKIADNVVNSMVGVYIFKYHKEKWKELCINFNNIEFFPKNEMILIVKLTKVNPDGFILMPTTYGKGIYGPFTMMIKCKEKINLKLFK
jgi:hypothetical protein